MPERFQIVCAGVAVAATLLSAHAANASGGSCLPRTLTAEEQRAGERVLARLRPLLPPAPAGWKVDGADTTDIASGSCLDAATHQSRPQPVSVQVHRRFVREGPPPAATATNVPVPPVAAPEVQGRAQEQARARALEQQIADLQREEKAATAAYQAARAAGDSDGQRTAATRLRGLRLAMEQPRQELMEIHRAERQQRTADNTVRHEAAVASNRAMLATRRLAHVTINTNSGRALARASRVVPMTGVPLAIAVPGFSTNLLFGNGWRHANHEAYRPWDPSAPTSRVQDVNVRVEGPDDVRQALIGELDTAALTAVIEAAREGR